MRVRLVLLALLSIVVLATGPEAGSKAKAGYPAVVEYKAMLHVAGGITITKTRDGLQDCQPGQYWTMKLASDVNLSKKVTVQVLRQRSVSSTSASKAGSAESNHSLEAYRESNYCPPEDPVQLDQPVCRNITGTGSAALMPDPRRKGPGRVSIGISRTSGASQSLECMVLQISSTPKGSDLNPLDTPYSSMELPLNITALQMLRLGKGKKLIRQLHVGGPCDGAIVYQGDKIPSGLRFDAIPAISIYDHDTCELDGDINVEIKRLTKGR